MEWTDAKLSDVDEAARRLLSRLRLAQYWFRVVPGWSSCRIRVQYSRDGGWRRAAFNVDAAELVASQHDFALRDRLLLDWGERLERRFTAGSERAAPPRSPAATT